MELYGRLEERFGHMEWWPAEGPFEVMVGAVLTQRTAWTNVERALERLRSAGVRDPVALMALPVEELEDLVRPSGTYRQKARRLRALLALVTDGHGGDPRAFLARAPGDLRAELLGVHGIGPETADSIILYAAGGPVFVVDAYTRRVLGRLGVDADAPYDEVATWFKAGLPEDVGLYANFHACLVELAKEHCRVRPKCTGCPLIDICPSQIRVRR
jgi:endonuclease-3 related protein